MKNGKYDFWKKGFKNKSGSEEGYNIEDIKQSFEEQGYTDVNVITGNMLALMIAHGETGGYEGV